MYSCKHHSFSRLRKSVLYEECSISFLFFFFHKSLSHANLIRSTEWAADWAIWPDLSGAFTHLLILCCQREGWNQQLVSWFVCHRHRLEVSCHASLLLLLDLNSDRYQQNGVWLRQSHALTGWWFKSDKGGGEKNCTNSHWLLVQFFFTAPFLISLTPQCVELHLWWSYLQLDDERRISKQNHLSVYHIISESDNSKKRNSFMLWYSSRFLVVCNGVKLLSALDLNWNHENGVKLCVSTEVGW